MPGIDPTIRNNTRNTLATSDDALGIENHDASAGASDAANKAGEAQKPALSKPKDRTDYGDVGRPSYLDLLRRPPKQGDINKRTISVGPLDTSLGPVDSKKKAAPKRSDAGAQHKASGPKLSKAERAERERVARPDRGVGFAYGSAKLDRAAARAWFGQLSRDDRIALSMPGAIITVTGRASGTGSRAANERLANQRAEALRGFLRQMGVKCDIVLRTRLEASSKHDKAAARSATFKVTTSPEDGSMRTRDKEIGPPRKLRRPSFLSADAIPLSIAQLPASVRAAYRADGGASNRSPRVIGGYLILPAPNRGLVVAIDAAKVPAGHSMKNGCWVYARGRMTQALQPYPTDPDAIKQALPRHAREQLTARGLRQMRAANKWLNARIQHHIDAGKTPEQAKKIVEKEAHAKALDVFLKMAGAGG